MRRSSYSASDTPVSRFHDATVRRAGERANTDRARARSRGVGRARARDATTTRGMSLDAAREALDAFANARVALRAAYDGVR